MTQRSTIDGWVGIVVTLRPEWTTGQARFAVYAAMALISVGNGLFKPSMSCLVRKLYAPGDPRLDAGLGIFYLSVNVGAFLAPFMVAAIRARWGWHAAFGSAGVGLAIGLSRAISQRDSRPSTLASFQRG